MKKMSCAMAAIAVLGLSACNSQTNQSANDAVPPGDLATQTQPPASGDAPLNTSAKLTSATAMLQKADGSPAGTATAREVNGALTISISAEGLPAGRRGIHVHMTGRCDPSAFTSAGAHWNPANAQHGLDNAQGQHAGDMPNLEVGSDGRGTLEYTLKGGTMSGLLDTDGSAVVVHAGPDDQKTDPSGNSGDRIACGVFKAA